MAYVLREGQGSLFRNENRTNDKAPNARGEILIEGVLYEISSWTKEGSKGKFQSLSVKRKDSSNRRSNDERTQHKNSYTGNADLDDDIAF